MCLEVEKHAPKIPHANSRIISTGGEWKVKKEKERGGNRTLIVFEIFFL